LKDSIISAIKGDDKKVAKHSVWINGF
jgi:hypothetical protein